MSLTGPAVTALGRRLLFRAVAAAEKRPHSFDIDTIIDGGGPTRGIAKDSPYCGTVGCIAGHMVLSLAKSKDNNYEVYVDKKYAGMPGVEGSGLVSGTMAFAASLLGCSDDESDALFCRSEFNGRRVTARNLRERVRAWLRTGR